METVKAAYVFERDQLIDGECPEGITPPKLWMDMMKPPKQDTAFQWFQQMWFVLRMPWSVIIGNNGFSLCLPERYLKEEVLHSSR